MDQHEPCPKLLRAPKRPVIHKEDTRKSGRGKLRREERTGGGGGGGLRLLGMVCGFYFVLIEYKYLKLLTILITSSEANPSALRDSEQEPLSDNAVLMRYFWSFTSFSP